jgi:hypothetical protein
MGAASRSLREPASQRPHHQPMHSHRGPSAVTSRIASDYVTGTAKQDLAPLCSRTSTVGSVIHLCFRGALTPTPTWNAISQAPASRWETETL